MKHESERLTRVREAATAVGEIESVSADRIVISGDFSPGLVVPLHPGARVAVLNDDDAEYL